MLAAAVDVELGRIYYEDYAETLAADWVNKEHFWREAGSYLILMITVVCCRHYLNQRMVQPF